MTYQIDGNAVTDPMTCTWQPKEILGYTHAAAPIFSAKRTATWSFNALTAAQFSAIQAYDNGASHSVLMHVPGLASTTTYTTVYIRVTNAGRTIGGIVMGAEIEVWNITA